ncbi:hypothetical protein NJ76_02895, partial [Rhodococcus sp. IITR03]
MVEHALDVDRELRTDALVVVRQLHAVAERDGELLPIDEGLAQPGHPRLVERVVLLHVDRVVDVHLGQHREHRPQVQPAHARRVVEQVQQVGAAARVA